MNEFRNFKQIETALGVPDEDKIVYPAHAIVVKVDHLPIKDEDMDKDLSADYNTVRKNLRELVDCGKGALDGIMTVALEGDSPRAYEVVAQMIKTLAEANREVLDLHDRVKKIRKTENTTNNVSNTTNSIYVGSTKELQDIINTARSSTNAFANRPDILESIHEDRDE